MGVVVQIVVGGAAPRGRRSSYTPGWWPAVFPGKPANGLPGKTRRPTRYTPDPQDPPLLRTLDEVVGVYRALVERLRRRLRDRHLCRSAHRGSARCRGRPWTRRPG